MFHDSLSVMLVVIDHDNIISALVLPTALIDWKTAIGTLFMIMACCVCARLTYEVLNMITITGTTGSSVEELFLIERKKNSIIQHLTHCI